tara:strand:- start:19602 stop:20258 length:657 start_codon:yes stop_codon:yes gene_type:complete
MIEWFVACLYIVSGLLLFLGFRFLFSLFSISWWLPVKLLKLLIYFFLSALFFVSANQLSSYYISDIGTQIAEIEIHYLAKQRYSVTLTKSELSADKTQFNINGDHWQLDLRLITWHRLLAGLGLDSIYRLERISGRYQLLDNELNTSRTIYQLSEDKISDKLWAYISSYTNGLFFRANYGAGLYGPMSDNAKYGVFLTATGSEVLPLNESAKNALNHW